ncbi:MAG: TIGR04372 family glycosyltransferase [Proteobacteria bacterium]|nr:TIGR04372 family glycosyltransferase [Pseudomonadota bacterium]
MAFDDLPDLSPLRSLKPFEGFEFNRRSKLLKVDGQRVVFALALDRTLGDFVMQNLMAASISQSLGDCRLHLYYRDDRPFKSQVVALNPHVHKIWKSPGGMGLPVELFDVAAEAPVKAAEPDWYTSFAASPDLLLTPTMMKQETLRSCETVARFRMPEDQVSEFQQDLVARGLDPHRWFCVLHYREAGYQARGPNALRDIDPEIALAVTRHIIETLGGQVVRIGHQGMARFPEMPGLVELSDVADGFMLQAFAISRARFFFEVSASGPALLAMAFGTPVARCNTPDLEGPLCERSILLPMHLVGPTGDRVPQDLALAKGLIGTVAVQNVLGPDGYRFQKNSVAELLAAAGEIVDRTSDCQSWRSAGPVAVAQGRNSLPWPMARRAHFKIVEYPEAFPEFSVSGGDPG